MHLLRLRPVPVPWSASGRAVLVLVLPLAIALALDHAELGALISTGALPIVLADSEGPYRQHAIRCGAAAVAATIGYLLGALTVGSSLLSAVMVVLLAMTSVLISGAGQSASTAGLMLLVFGVVGAGTHLVDIGLGVLVGGFVLGAAWSLLIALAGWTVRGTHPERSAVAQVFVELAVMLSAEDEATSRAARHQLTVAMNVAFDRLLTARTRVPGRDAAYRSLLTLLSQASPIVEASVALVNSGQRAPQPVVDHLTRIAVAVLAGTELPMHPKPPACTGIQPALDALFAGVARLGTGRERVPDEPAPFRTWASELLAALIPDRTTGKAMARLTLCIGIAEAIGLMFASEHSTWIALTVAIVLKPELGSIFGRAVLRGIGTVAGVLLAAIVLVVHPHGWLLAVLAGVFAAGIPVGKALNYGILSACVTPLIIVQLDIQNLGDPTLLLQRLGYTVLGCVIVLVAGYWLWPGSLRPRAGGQVADALVRVQEYVQLALRPVAADQDRVTRTRARRRAYRASADLRTAFGEVIVEPSEAGRHAISMWSAIIALEQITDAVTELVVTVERGGQPPDEADIAILVDVLTELAESIREGRERLLPVLPSAGPLSTVADPLTALSAAIRGPR